MQHPDDTLAVVSVPVQHHLVSVGYQKNFATDDRRVAVVDARTGALIQSRRAIRKNWRQEHWHSVVDPDTGAVDASLEETFSKIETTVLDTIRHVRAGRLDKPQAGAIINLFAIHLARSRTLRPWHDELSEESLPTIIREIASDRGAIERFRTQFGRLPASGELELIARRISERSTASGEWRRDSIARNHDGVAERLESLHIQIVEVDERLPGLVLGDVPVVHANLKDGRFGYRDRLAVGDADLIIGPLTRRVLVCFSAQREKHARITTKRKLKDVVGLFARAAVSEVCCHPDDLLSLQRTCRNLPPLRRP